MKYFIIIIILFSECEGQNTSLVINKFKTDNKSRDLYYSLCESYEKDKESAYDFYLSEYNKKEPLPRLFDYLSIANNIQKFGCNEKSYHKLVSNKKNYISDERTPQYMIDYLENYFIRIDSD